MEFADPSFLFLFFNWKGKKKKENPSFASLFPRVDQQTENFVLNLRNELKSFAGQNESKMGKFFFFSEKSQFDYVNL